MGKDAGKDARTTFSSLVVFNPEYLRKTTLHFIMQSLS